MAKIKKPKPKKAVPPKKMKTGDLCKSLAAIAAFHVEDSAAQMKIYEAIRRLQVLDEVAVKAGVLLP